MHPSQPRQGLVNLGSARLVLFSVVEQSDPRDKRMACVCISAMLFRHGGVGVQFGRRVAGVACTSISVCTSDGQRIEQ